MEGFGLRLRVLGLGFGVQGLGFRVWDLGFRVWEVPKLGVPLKGIWGVYRVLQSLGIFGSVGLSPEGPTAQIADTVVPKHTGTHTGPNRTAHGTGCKAKGL